MNTALAHSPPRNNLYIIRIRVLSSFALEGALAHRGINGRDLATKDVCIEFVELNLTLTELCELFRMAYGSWGFNTLTLERTTETGDRYPGDNIFTIQGGQ